MRQPEHLKKITCRIRLGILPLESGNLYCIARLPYSTNHDFFYLYLFVC